MRQAWIAALVGVALVGGAVVGATASAQSAPERQRCAAVGVPVNTNSKKAAERGDYNSWVPLPPGWTAVGGASYVSGTVVVIACTTSLPTTDGSWTQDPL